MVAINGREVISRAVGVLRTNYNRCLGKLFFGGRTSLGRSSSFVRSNIKRQIAPSGQVSKGRKQGHAERKRHNTPARSNSSVLMPGGFPKDCKGQAGPSTQEQCGQGTNVEPAKKEGDLIMREFNSLMFDKSLRESWFEVTAVSERVKAQAAERKAALERETREAERLWKMQESERREKKRRAGRWKDKRLAQLERERNLAQSELAREKLDRKHSKLQRAFQEQEWKRKTDERWKQLMETDAKIAAERERDLLRENAMLRNNLRAKDNAFQRAHHEKEYMKQKREKERAGRLRAEESLCRWKEMMNEYFPRGQQTQQHPGRPLEQPRPEQSPLQAQFELYEKKWEVLRSGVDVNGSKVHRIFFYEIPWPVINMTLTDPSQIRPEHIGEFLVHPDRVKHDAHGKRKNGKLIAKEELKKWHSDKFDSIVLPIVYEEDKAAATEVAGMVARVLTDMLN